RRGAGARARRAHRPRGRRDPLGRRAPHRLAAPARRRVGARARRRLGGARPRRLRRGGRPRGDDPPRRSGHRGGEARPVAAPAPVVREAVGVGRRGGGGDRGDPSSLRDHRRFADGLPRPAAGSTGAAVPWRNWAAALLLAAACSPAVPVLAPIVDVPDASSPAYPFTDIDELRLSIAHAGQDADIALVSVAPGDTPELASVPFGDDLVVHLSGRRAGVEVAYGRTCAVSVN